MTIYVGNLPFRCSSTDLRDFINSQVYVHGFAIAEGDPVSSCKVYTSKAFAFVKFRSSKEASMVLHLDGILFENHALRFSRPRKFYEKLQHLSSTALCPTKSVLSMAQSMANCWQPIPIHPSLLDNKTSVLLSPKIVEFYEENKKIKLEFPKSKQDVKLTSSTKIAPNIKSTYQAEPFIDDIYIYLKQREARFIVKRYLQNQLDIDQHTRATLVDWIVEIVGRLKLNHDTLYLSVKVVDLFLMQRFVAKSQLQLLGATAIFIAAKFHERCPALLTKFLKMYDTIFERRDLLKLERIILQTINFELGVPSSYQFLNIYAKNAGICMKRLTLARYILETALMDADFLEVPESKVAAASLFLTFQMKAEHWSPNLEIYTGYKKSDLKDVCILLKKNIRNPIDKNLGAIRTKYSHPIFFEVAKTQDLGGDLIGLL